ncbi:MAG: 16S rRNA (uracil(1498)-N(3))-methyltransferase [Actinobacteria bacterium]|nr:16S rRNA (uracil(1498)-N(3))-methyltransferase [Actinomycetota bacterium]
MAHSGPDGTAGPHVFVADLHSPEVGPDDRHHLERSLRLRNGDPLTVGDGDGRWRECRFGDHLETVGGIVEVAQPPEEVTVGFSMLKGQRPELILQKLTELGVDRILPLLAERSIVRWDADKRTAQHDRFLRIAREAAMQSRRVRLPVIERITETCEVANRPGTALAQAGGRRLHAGDRTILVGPEGGWTPTEVEGHDMVDLGPTVLRAETAAIAAGTLLTALRDRRVAPPL